MFDRLAPIKTAEIGLGNDSSFEKALSDIAHAYIKDKAPKLLDFELGFQLIEKNEDNTRAVGAFGFKIGQHLILCYVFFLNGQLKGHDMLHIKEQDLIVPLKEKWINYLLGRSSVSIGKSTDRNLSELGVSSPFLRQIKFPPYKYGSAKEAHAKLPGWLNEALNELSYLVTVSPGYDPKFNKLATVLEDFIKDSDSEIYYQLNRICYSYPLVKKAFIEYYPSIHNKIACSTKKNKHSCKFKAIMRNKFKHKKEGSILSFLDNVDNIDKTAPGLTIIDLDANIIEKNGKMRKLADSDFDNLSMEEKGKLLLDRFIIKYDSDSDVKTKVKYDKPKVYDATMPVVLINPTETGLHSVLIKPGVFKKCLILVNPISGAGEHNLCTVIDIPEVSDKDNSDRSYFNTTIKNVWVRDSSSRFEYQKWFDSLPDNLNSIPTTKTDSVYVIIGPNGEATLPFRFIHEYPDSEKPGEIEEYTVSFLPSITTGSGDTSTILFSKFNSPSRKALSGIGGTGYTGDIFKALSSQRIILTHKKGSRLRALGSDLIVPKGFKLLKIENSSSEQNEKSEFYSANPTISRFVDEEKRKNPSYNDPKKAPKRRITPMMLGRLLDLHLMLLSNGKDIDLEYYSDSNIKLNDQQYDKKGAYIKLAKEYNLHPDQIDALMQKAKFNPIKIFVKSGEIRVNPMVANAPNAPPIPDLLPSSDDIMPPAGANTQVPQELLLPVTSTRAMDRNLDNPENLFDPTVPDQKALQIAQQAAQMGQKEVFDVSILSNLLRMSDDELLIDRYLPDLLTGMDRLGRLRLIMYWHGDIFSKRYGQDKLAAIEDLLKSAFEQIGDIYLELKNKQQTIEDLGFAKKPRIEE